jgi:arylsulfatase
MGRREQQNFKTGQAKKSPLMRWSGLLRIGNLISAELRALQLTQPFISLAPTLLGKKQDPRPFLYREFPAYGGQQSIRVGDWKAVRQNLNPREKGAQPKMQIELYDLAKDPAETADVSAKHPEVVRRLKTLMREQHTPSKDFPFPALDLPKR